MIISDQIATKLKDKHGVTPAEVEQCFLNRTGKFLIDTREDHVTNPPTQWFVAETNRGRKLKVAFVFKAGKVYLKTAYDPNPKELAIYNAHG